METRQEINRRLRIDLELMTRIQSDMSTTIGEIREVTGRIEHSLERLNEIDRLERRVA